MVSVKRRETWSCRLEKKSIRLLLSFWIVWWLISLQHRYEKKVGGKWYRDDISLKYQNLQAYVITAQMQTTRTQADSAVSCYILHSFLGSNRKVDNTTAHFSKTLNPFSLHDRTTEMKHNPDVQRIKWCQKCLLSCCLAFLWMCSPWKWKTVIQIPPKSYCISESLVNIAFHMHYTFIPFHSLFYEKQISCI